MKVLEFEKFRRMLPQQMDHLPGPVEFRATVTKRRRTTIEGRRMIWVGIGWVDDGEPSGTEGLLVMAASDPAFPVDAERFEWLTQSSPS